MVEMVISMVQRSENITFHDSLQAATKSNSCMLLDFVELSYRPVFALYNLSLQVSGKIFAY